MKKLLFFLLIVLSFFSCSSSDEEQEKLVLSNSSLSLKVKDTDNIKFNIDCSSIKSMDEKIAIAQLFSSTMGEVTAVAPGETDIVVTSEDSQTAICHVSVDWKYDYFDLPCMEKYIDDKVLSQNGWAFISGIIDHPSLEAEERYYNRTKDGFPYTVSYYIKYTGTYYYKSIITAEENSNVDVLRMLRERFGDRPVVKTKGGFVCYCWDSPYWDIEYHNNNGIFYVVFWSKYVDYGQRG